MPKKVDTKKKVVAKKVTKKPVVKKVTKKPIAKKVAKTVKVTKTTKTTKASSKAKVASKTKKPTAKAKKDLMFTNNEQSFWVNDGQILNSLLALHEALQAMNDDVFYHHANQDKNDFADWVEFVLCDGSCATDLRKVEDKAKASTVVGKHLKTYKV